MTQTIEERLASLEAQVRDLKERELSDLKKTVGNIDKRTYGMLLVMISILATLVGALLVKL